MCPSQVCPWLDEEADDAVVGVCCRDFHAEPDALVVQVEAPVGADVECQILFGTSLAFDDQTAIAPEPCRGPEGEGNGKASLEFEVRPIGSCGWYNHWSSYLQRYGTRDGGGDGRKAGKLSALC
jgi:hypothetical protein